MAEDMRKLGLGIDGDTGRALSGWAHVVQSLRVIFTTPFGSRIMREWYGSLVPEALGRNINRQEIVPVIASITSAIEQWEPRFVVDRVRIPEASREGRLEIVLEGRYRPRALLGDMREDGARTLNLGLSGVGLLIE